jgi:PAS domain S-box-containing protein
MSSYRSEVLPEEEHNRPPLVNRQGDTQDDRFFTLSLDMLCIAGFDGYFKRLNPAFEKALSFTQRELFAKPFLEFVHPEDQAATLAEEQKLVAGVSILNFENRCRCQDGSYKWLSWTATPDLAEGLIYAIAHDVTQYKQIEQRLQDARTYAESIVQTVREPLLVLDADLRVKTANESFYQTFQVLPENTEQKFIYQLGNGQWNIPKLRSLLEEILPQNIWLQDFEVDYTSPATKQRTLLLNARRICSQEGSPTQLILLALEDITERKQVEKALAEQTAELERSNAELQQFAYVASHDLQEPLRMVASYTQLLARRYKDKLDTDANEFIDYAVDGATRMQTLINDLLAYSRVGTKGKSFDLTDCEVIWERALANLQEAIAESSARVSHDPLPTVIADDLQLSQLFQNLISNAIKFRRDDQPPQIHVSAKRKDKELVFSVRDNGIGIDSRYVERIFVIFQRLHNKEDYPGTGIGLAICKKIVERHRGRIWIESQPNQGTTVYFTIPMVQQAE